MPWEIPVRSPVPLVYTNEGDRCVNRLFQLKALGIVAEVWTGFCGITELIPDSLSAIKQILY